MESAEFDGAENEIWRFPPSTEREEESSAIAVPAETVPVATVPTAPVPFPKRTWPPESEVAPVPPPATPKVPVIVASERQVLSIAKQPSEILKPFEAVVEPVFPMEKSVVVAKLLVVELILKSESAFEVEAANRERRP